MSGRCRELPILSARKATHKKHPNGWSPSALFSGEFFLNPDKIGVLLMESAIHCRPKVSNIILIERVQQGIQTLSEGKLHKENTRMGGALRLFLIG
ncbi:hypothetical protein J7L68_09280 [bacterium]|nr:hypothetical protein [bacterium]